MSESAKSKKALFSLRANLLFWAVFAVGLAVDLWSKQAVFAWLKKTPYPMYSVIDGFLRLVVRENPGAAWGIASGKTTFLIIISAAAFFAVLGIFFLSVSSHKFTHIFLAMFASGIVGNLYDRVFNDGKVRDFIEVYYGDWAWPAFNAADSLLCVSVFFLIVINLFAGKAAEVK